MKKRSIKTKIGAMVLTVMMTVSIITYPGVLQLVDADTTSTTSLAVDDTFTANIKNNEVENLLCDFTVLAVAEDGKPGVVKVGNNDNTSAIADTTAGTIEIPDEIIDPNTAEKYTVISIGNDAFRSCTNLISTGLESNSTVTEISDGAFRGCTNLESTGLAGNSSVASIGDSVFRDCTNLKSTGLESNSTITWIANYAFSGCTSLQNTGLESNNTVTSIEGGAFANCANLTSTGLESNSTVTNVGYDAFENCTSLGNVIFKITTLPNMDNMGSGVFDGTNANIYYLAGTTNIDQLTDCGATSFGSIAVNTMTIKAEPKCNILNKVKNSYTVKTK